MTKSLEEQLKDIEKQIQGKINKEISFDKFFPEIFIQNHSKYNSISELMDNSGFKCETQEEFEAIDEDLFDKYIQENTDFQSWEDMKNAAGVEYVKRQLEQ